MNKLLLLIICSTLGLSANAADWYPSSELTQKDNIEFEPLHCPTIGKDYSQMLGQLQTLQDSISKDANCGQLAKNLQSIGLLAGDRRKSFLESIEKIKKGEDLKDTEVKSKIIDYVEDVTVAAGTLGVMLSEGDQCFGKKDPTTALSALSSFVNEASTLLGSIGGPWGSALAIAGKVSAGFLTGVSKFIASRPGYKFYDKKDWQGYVETLCAFHEQQDAIESLIHPDQAVSDLNSIQSDLQQAIDIFHQQVPQTDLLIQSFKNQDNQALADISSEINSLTNSKLGITMIQVLSAQRWVETRIDNIVDEANDPLAPSKYLVQKYRDEIEDFMFDKQAPSFLNFQDRETQDAISDLEDFARREGTMIYNQMRSFEPPKDPLRPENAFSRPRVTLEESVKAILESDEYAYFDKGEKGAQLASLIVYFKREINQKWDAVNISNGTKKSFCTFFERGGYLTLNIRSACYSRQSKYASEAIEKWISMGLNKSTPIYISRSKRFKGNNWIETLGNWSNSL